MSKIAIVYWSDTGNTESMANGIFEGITEAGGEAVLIKAADFNADACKDYDAFAFGCPAMGAEILEEDVFEPMFTDVEKELAGKSVVLFGSYDWGDGEWMREWESRTINDGANVLATIICTLEPGADAINECKEGGKKLIG